MVLHVAAFTSFSNSSRSCSSCDSYLIFFSATSQSFVSVYPVVVVLPNQFHAAPFLLRGVPVVVTVFIPVVIPVIIITIYSHQLHFWCRHRCCHPVGGYLHLHLLLWTSWYFQTDLHSCLGWQKKGIGWTSTMKLYCCRWKSVTLTSVPIHDFGSIFIVK